MRDTWSDPEFGAWSVEGISPQIEYSLGTIDEVAAAAQEGLQRLSRGGIEVGGILYGKKNGQGIRIEAWRPIACEHARGPAFLLSPKDEAALAEALKSSDPALGGLEPLGWFVSHTRSELAMKSEEATVFGRYFPEPWQVTLIVRPARHRSTDAGFFVREAGGKVRMEASHHTFTITPHVKLGVAKAPRHPSSPAQTAPAPDTAIREEEAGASAEVPPERRHWLNWRWVVAFWILLAAAAVVVVAKPYLFPNRPATFSFRATDMDGQMRIEWDHQGKWITQGQRGVIEITDGDRSQKIDLDAEFLHSGSYVYMRKLDDVSFRMTVYYANRPPISEITRFLGQPTTLVMGAELARAIRERNVLAAQITKLHQSLAKESARSTLLERDLQSLRRRLQSIQPSAQQR